ncbi:MAG: Biotin transporter BioY [Firmicutes bacterium ADurb.BinA205]|nr:MAG: Biotin transporter BioY [Firmicutes bacterium ADurb.BinA205]
MSELTANSKKAFTTRELVLIAMFSALTAVCAWISIPFGPIVFTLQTFAVFLTVSVIGGRNGFFSILVYILLGAVGFPVFAHFKGGVSALLSNTGGYIVGFILIPLIFLAAEKMFGNSMTVKITAFLIGLAVCYTFGTAWFMFAYGRNVGEVTLAQAMKWCVLPFVPFDIIKMILAIILADRIKKALPKN